MTKPQALKKKSSFWALRNPCWFNQAKFQDYYTLQMQESI